MGDVSHELLEHFERSTARVNAAERKRVRRARRRRLIIFAVLVTAFAAGVYASCVVPL